MAEIAVEFDCSTQSIEALQPMLEAWPGFTIEAFAAYAKHHYTPRLRDHLCRGIAQGWPA